MQCGAPEICLDGAARCRHEGRVLAGGSCRLPCTAVL